MAYNTFIALEAPRPIFIAAPAELFLRSKDGKIGFLREYFDPVKATKALDTPILGIP